MMRKGSKAKITCPFDLTYGAKGIKSKVPPFTDFIYTLTVNHFDGAGEEEVEIMERPIVHPNFDIDILEEGEGPLLANGLIVDFTFNILLDGKILKE